MGEQLKIIAKQREKGKAGHEYDAGEKKKSCE